MFTVDLPIVLLVVAITLLGVAALGFGAESRPGFSR